MDDLLDEYKAYYRTRAERYANNPNYQNSFQAESNLSAAMDSCNELIEFKEKMGNLNEMCAVALVKDEHIMEREFFEKHKETVRVLASQRILEKVDTAQNSQDLVTMVTEISNQNSLEISMDEWQREFQGDWKLLDEIEIFENAIVPDKYKSQMAEVVSDIKSRLVKSIQESEEEAHKFDPNFRFKPELNLEHRHRRLIPYSDEHIQEHLNKYKNIVNR